MALARPAIFQWAPLGLSDARDGRLAFPGACKLLTNLIHDPVSSNMLAPRPAAFSITSFAGLTSPGVVSVQISVGTKIYGMIASGLNAGYDQPFCYDTVAQAFVAISGVTSTNVPATQGTSGAWTPPVMVLVGTYIVITHPGYTLSSGPVGTINISTNVYASGNLQQGTTNVLPAVPTSVGTFYNRAWYAVNNFVYFSDPLTPLTQTNAGQALVIGSASEKVTAFAPQGLSTATQGVLAALLVFKHNSIWQITGDYSLSNLALNELTASVGCSAPRTVQPTPVGVMFMANDGIRTIPVMSSGVSEPNKDVLFPFFNCTNPSRACAAYSADTYRISLDTITTTDVLGRFEYWYSFKTGKWSGPHTFPADTITAFQNTFVLSVNSIGAQLFQSNPFTSTNDSFTENGIPLTVNMTSSLIDPNPPMSEKTAVEMTAAAVYGTQTYTVQILDSQNNLISQTTLSPVSAPAVWGGAGLAWGAPGLVWGSAPYNTSVAPLNFPVPLVFKTCQIVLTGLSSYYFRLGRFDLRYEPLLYTGAG